MMKPGKVEKKQTVTTFTTESTDPEKTKNREGRAERMAKGEGRWNTSGRRTDGAEKKGGNE